MCQYALHTFYLDYSHTRNDTFHSVLFYRTPECILFCHFHQHFVPLFEKLMEHSIKSGAQAIVVRLAFLLYFILHYDKRIRNNVDKAIRDSAIKQNRYKAKKKKKKNTWNVLSEPSL